MHTFIRTLAERWYFGSYFRFVLFTFCRRYNKNLIEKRKY